MGWVGRTGRRTRKRVEPASGLETVRNLRSRNQQKSVGNMTGLSCFVRDTSRLHSHRHARSAAPPVDPRASVRRDHAIGLMFGLLGPTVCARRCYAVRRQSKVFESPNCTVQILRCGSRNLIRPAYRNRGDSGRVGLPDSMRSLRPRARADLPHGRRPLPGSPKPLGASATSWSALQRNAHPAVLATPWKIGAFVRPVRLCNDGPSHGCDRMSSRHPIAGCAMRQGAPV